MEDKQLLNSLKTQQIYEKQLASQSRIPYLKDVPPCPFCGEQPKPIVHEIEGFATNKQVRCVNPHCPTRPFTKCFETLAEAKEAWSKRA